MFEAVTVGINVTIESGKVGGTIVYDACKTGANVVVMIDSVLGITTWPTVGENVLIVRLLVEGVIVSRRTGAKLVSERFMVAGITFAPTNKVGTRVDRFKSSVGGMTVSCN